MKLSQHFDSSEWAQHAAHGFAAQDYPAAWIESRLKLLATALEVVRAKLGKAISINSGFRSEAYNRAIGGARLSQHVQGRAADIVVADVKPSTVHDTILALYESQAIIIGGLGSYPTFTHVDVRPQMRLARWTGSRKEN